MITATPLSNLSRGIPLTIRAASIHATMLQAYYLLGIDHIEVPEPDVLHAGDVKSLQDYIEAGKSIPESAKGNTISSIRTHCNGFGDQISKLRTEG